MTSVSKMTKSIRQWSLWHDMAWYIFRIQHVIMSFILNSSMIMGILPNGELRSHKTYHFYPGLCNPHLKELVHPRNLKTPNFVLHSNSNLSPAFLKLSDTANVRFQDVFLKFWSNFYHLKWLTVADIWQIPTKANVNLPLWPLPSFPWKKIVIPSSIPHFFRWEQQPQDYIPLDLAPQEVQLGAPSDWAPADWWSPGNARNSPRPQALSYHPFPVNFFQRFGKTSKDWAFQSFF